MPIDLTESNGGTNEIAHHSLDDLLDTPHTELAHYAYKLQEIVGPMARLQLEQREKQDKQDQEVETDPLTGLLNKQAWKETLEAMVSDEAGKFGVLFLDFSGFKRVNDNLDHDTGDRLLLKFADSLKKTLRGGVDDKRQTDIVSHERFFEPTDDLTGGRLGGDEFAIICDLTSQENPKLSDEERLEAIKLRLRQSFDKFVGEQSEEVKKLGFDIAMGGSLWKPGVTAADLLKKADNDMKRDKKARKDAVKERQPRHQRAFRQIGHWALRLAGDFDERVH